VAVRFKLNTVARSTDQPYPELTRGGVIGLLRRGCWASLPTATIESLIAGGRVIDFPAGQTVYTEADHERLAVLLRGLLRVYMHANDGRQVTVRYVRAGDLLGVPALVGGPAPVFVQAVTSGSAFFFDVDRVKRAARSDAAVAWALAEESVHRLYDVLEELAGNTFASVRQRVARHLLDLAASRPGASGQLTAPVSQQDLANSVGSAREVVARVLAELRAEGIVLTSPGRVEILDPVRMSRELWSRARDESHSP
jgi:CRP/FNR family transcriptional regulator, cyclic AMP receptor protein